jgi:hypothetical protein
MAETRTPDSGLDVGRQHRPVRRELGHAELARIDPREDRDRSAAFDLRHGTPVLPFTHAVFVVGVLLTAGTGIGLFGLADRTADYWAWTMRAPGDTCLAALLAILGLASVVEERRLRAAAGVTS